MAKHSQRKSYLYFVCNNGDIGDEFHYILECSAIDDSRQLLLKKPFINRPNILKFQGLMNSSNPSELNNLCKFIRIIIKCLESPG